jgi:hypothetical protein
MPTRSICIPKSSLAILLRPSREITLVLCGVGGFQTCEKALLYICPNPCKSMWH